MSLSGKLGGSQIRIRSDSDQVFGRAEKNTRVNNSKTTNPTKLPVSKKKQRKMM